MKYYQIFFNKKSLYRNLYLTGFENLSGMTQFIKYYLV